MCRTAEGRDRRAESALEKLAAMRPSPLFDRGDLARIRPGNVEDHCARLAECDWVIEAVFEDLAVKADASGRHWHRTCVTTPLLVPTRPASQ